MIINPKTVNEKLLYCTVRIVGLCNNQPFSVGTGFFYQFNIGKNNIVFILTNKHVIEEKIKYSLCFHERDITDDFLPTNRSFTVTIDDISKYTMTHPNSNVDLEAISFYSIMKDVEKEHNKRIYYTCINEELIKSDLELNDVCSVADSLTMAGYPNGLWDVKANFPIIRKGIAASPPALDFNGKSVGVVDMACFPGSSGSPILILKEGSWVDKDSNTNIGKNLLIFIGLLYATAKYDKIGEIINVEIPTKKNKIAKLSEYMHIGFYIKAKEILVLCEQYKKKLYYESFLPVPIKTTINF